MMKHILVTNDDGIQSPGLLALAQALRSVGRVSILAPDTNWSMCGHNKTMSRALHLSETTLMDGSKAWSADGSPSDCVALATLGFIEEPIDLVVSGINPYPNAGSDVSYSGTVAAAIEAALGGYPALAVSLDAPFDYSEEKDFAPAAQVSALIAQKVLTNTSLPAGVILNINVPFLAYAELKGIRLTCTGERIYHNTLVRRNGKNNEVEYWLGGDFPESIPTAGTDFLALNQGFVSISPLRPDLTATDILSKMDSWQLDL